MAPKRRGSATKARRASQTKEGGALLPDDGIDMSSVMSMLTEEQPSAKGAMPALAAAGASETRAAAAPPSKPPMLAQTSFELAAPVDAPSPVADPTPPASSSPTAAAYPQRMARRSSNIVSPLAIASALGTVQEGAAADGEAARPRERRVSINERAPRRSSVTISAVEPERRGSVEALAFAASLGAQPGGGEIDVSADVRDLVNYLDGTQHACVRDARAREQRAGASSHRV